MAWIEKKEQWFEKREGRSREKDNGKSIPTLGQIRDDEGYTISEVMGILKVGRSTVFKWLSIEHPDQAVIPWEGWGRMADNSIRIHGWALKNLFSPNVKNTHQGV